MPGQPVGQPPRRPVRHPASPQSLRRRGHRGSQDLGLHLRGHHWHTELSALAKSSVGMGRDFLTWVPHTTREHCAEPVLPRDEPAEHHPDTRCPDKYSDTRSPPGVGQLAARCGASRTHQDLCPGHQTSSHTSGHNRTQREPAGRSGSVTRPPQARPSGYEKSGITWRRRGPCGWLVRKSPLGLEPLQLARMNLASPLSQLKSNGLRKVPGFTPFSAF